MAARKKKGTKDKPWSEATREKIKASMLIKSLSDHVVSGTKMQSTQVTAALGLLKKVLPDLQSTEIQGEITQQTWIGPPPKTAEEWEEKHGETKH